MLGTQSRQSAVWLVTSCWGTAGKALRRSSENIAYTRQGGVPPPPGLVPSAVNPSCLLSLLESSEASQPPTSSEHGRLPWRFCWPNCECCFVKPFWCLSFLGSCLACTCWLTTLCMSPITKLWVEVIYATHGSESLPVRERPSRILSFLLTWTWSAFDMVAALSAWVIERLMSQGPLPTWDGHLAWVEHPPWSFKSLRFGSCYFEICCE